MRRHFFASALIACAVATTAISTPLRPFTVGDSIALSSFVRPGSAFGQQAERRVIRSPEGKYWAAVTTKGDLASGKRVATLWVFDSRKIEQAFSKRKLVAPRVVATWASASNTEPISQWRWRSDGRALLFLGANDEGLRSLVSASLNGSRPKVLSAPGQDVERYAEADGHLVYLAGPTLPELRLFDAGDRLPDIVEGFGQGAFTLLFPEAIESLFPGQFEDAILWRIGSHGPVPVNDLRTGRPIKLTNSSLQLSRDGRRVVALRYAAHIPKIWENYLPPSNNPSLRIVPDKPGQPTVEGIFRPRSYWIINVATGEQDILLHTPIDYTTQFEDVLGAWSPDGKLIAIRGAYPLLTDGEKDVLPCALGVVEVATAKLTCLQVASAVGPNSPGHMDRPQITDLQWHSDDSLFVWSATPNAPDRTREIRFIRHGGKWTSDLLTNVASDGAIQLVIHETFDEVPIVLARLADGPSLRIFDPNPQLRNIAEASVKLYSWKDPDGNIWTGALMLPPGYKHGRRYPLVIQTHGLNRAEFLVDGPSHTGFAARALAARGIAVLQVDELEKKLDTPGESSFGAAGYRAAIKALDAQGIIDSHKVGAIAWSHYGPWVMQGLVDKPLQYAAVSFASAFYNSYDEYLMNVDYLGGPPEKWIRAQVGPKPFGQGLEVWMQRSAGFHTDRVCTPTLWQFNNPMDVVYGWGSYAALRAQHKPVDLLYLRGGAHSLVKPRERLAEQELNVDWFDYWLNGHKDPNPAKLAEYARWDALKANPRCGDEGSTPPLFRP